jgi:hypothetical protein
MSVPGFTAESSHARTQRVYRTGGLSPGRAAGVLPQANHEPPPLKRPLLSSGIHTCTGAAECFHLAASGACTGPGYIICSESDCQCGPP